MISINVLESADTTGVVAVVDVLDEGVSEVGDVDVVVVVVVSVGDVVVVVVVVILGPSTAILKEAERLLPSISNTVTLRR